jgi:hypothetical protein
MHLHHSASKTPLARSLLALVVPVAALVLVATSADVAQARSCPQRKVKQIRRHVACRLKAELLEGAAKTAAQDDCDARFMSRWLRIEARGGTDCSGTGALGPVKAFSDVCSSTLAAMASTDATPPQCIPTTTSTTVTSSTICVDVDITTTTTTMYLPPHCLNEVTDEDETDVDCGGSCYRCGTNQACNSGFDCYHLVCTSGTCALATCNDNVRNADESGKDCGGPVCPPCPDGETCFRCADCESGKCDRTDFFGGCVP